MPALSDGFLAAQRRRLDAIGPWSIREDWTRSNLDIEWRSPAGLESDWVPFGLRFHTDTGSPSFDPDERMFELWELYRRGHAEFAPALRRACERAFAADEPDDDPRRVARAWVEVSRLGVHRGTVHHDLSVRFAVSGDEHQYFVSFDEAAGRFSELQS